MIIAMDAMGGDNAPIAVVDGALEALKEHDVNIILIGDEDNINKELRGKDYDKKRVEVLHASEVIHNNEHPAIAIKKKRDSSIVKALTLVKDGKADAVISAGSTGAFLTGATLIVGRINGIKRPALAPIMPGKNNSFMVIDVGGNVDCKPEFLEQFAIMGKVYFENVMNVTSPKIGIVNIGEEEGKGNELTKNTYPLLKANKELNFIGNVEPRDIATGDVHVIVCDGFVGNTILKMYEGVTKTVFDILKEEIYSSTRTKIGGLMLKPVFKAINKRYDYKEVGGSPFLGTKGICIKAHGSSDKRAFKNAIKQAVIVHENKIIEKISMGVCKLD